MSKIYLHINTTGDCFDDDKIESISALMVNDANEIQDYFYEDIQEYACPSFKRQYHFKDCTVDKLIIANDFMDKLNGFKEFIQDEVLISHYKYFEYEFLRRAMKFAGLSMIKNEWIDLQENFIMQNNFGGDIYDIAKKLKLSFNENNNFFSVANAVSDLHNRMLN